MLIGATVLCFLVMLALIADRFGGFLWHGSREKAFFRCDECDLRYLRRQMSDPHLQVCPVGHVVYEERRSGIVGLIGIFVCMGFLFAALAFMLSGLIPVGS